MTLTYNPAAAAFKNAPAFVHTDEYRDFVTAPAVSISAGNDKTGAVPTFNLLPGDGLHKFANGKFAVNVPGSCAGVCDGCKGSCYAMRSLRYRGAVKAWAANTWAAMVNPAAVRSDIVSYCLKHKPAVFRLHSAGEFVSYEYFEQMTMAAEICRDTVFYCYTKHSDFLAKYAAKYGDLPSNFVVRVSMWNGTVQNHTGALEFHYDDGTDATAAALPHCPAVMLDGKPRIKANGERFTCADCRYQCAFSRRNMAVYAH